MLALTWLCSVTTGAIITGIYFVAKSAYGFGSFENLLLGLVMGAAYIPGAMLVGPALRRLARRVPWIATRDVLLALVIGIGLIAMIPWAAGPRAWVIWPVLATTNAMTGAMWPIVESYLSGGRRADKLRRAVGWFNICWASAIVAAGWLMAPLLENRALMVLLFVGVVQGLSALTLFWYAKEPARHAAEEHHPHPPVYTRLLYVFRWLLPSSYVLTYCLVPILPTITSRLGVSLTWAAPLAATWALSRVGAFGVFWAWEGWHGKWATPVWTGATLLAGFGLAVTAGSVGALIAGLALFGVGMGGIYAAALYYAMEVGAAEVDAGGVHEALIGVGYTLGPLAGLLGLWVAKSGILNASAATLLIAFAFVCVGVACAVRSARRVPVA